MSDGVVEAREAAVVGVRLVVLVMIELKRWRWTARRFRGPRAEALATTRSDAGDDA